MRSVLAILLALSITFAQDLTPEDFAAGITVTPVGENSLQVLELPSDVYTTLTRADLGDLRVFNAAGEVLPYALIETSRPTLEDLELPLYRLESETLSDALSVQIEQGEAGTSVQVDTASAPTPQAVYIIDQRSLDTAAQLRFEWADWEGISEVTLETSPDLERWRAHSVFSLAQLQSGGFNLNKNTLSAPEAAYLRLRAAPNETLPPLRGVYARISRRAERSSYERQIEAQTSDEGYLYDLGGPQRVTQVSLDAGETALARVTLESASSPDGPWTRAFGGVYFDLVQAGQRLEHGPLLLSEARARYWRLSADPASGLGARPTLTFSILSDQLAFLKRGAEPFTLAYGKYLVQPAAQPSLVSGSTVNVALDEPELATLSAPFELAGEAALTPETPLNWQPYVLWGVLLLGVGVLSVLALRLVRMKESQAD